MALNVDSSFCGACLSAVPSKAMPEISWLHHFAAAGFAGSFSAASYDLGVHRHTIANSVNQLEEYVGAPLFNRTNGRAYNSLTTEGRLLLPTATHTVALCASIRKAG